MPLLWEVGLLLPHPCSRPLFLTPPLLTKSLATLGGWLVAPPHSQCLFLALPLHAESLAPCPTPILWGLFSAPPHPVSVRLQLIVYISQFCSGRFNLSGGCPRAGRGSCNGAGAHLLGLQIYADSFENGWLWRNGVLLFSRYLLGLGSAWQGIGKLSIG
jgi:hypothetical protein